MKVTIRKDDNGVFKAYVRKKDLEEPIVYIDGAQLWGGRITLANGWQFQLPELADDTTLPVTVEARRVSGGRE
ncbi:putative nitrogen fixation protein NifT [Paraburkholderia sp. JHI2823]|uniref:putative nitrogen fixation protein NifT n=1 Tax=Paraburkholderia sp. JHI2823 TaxID=3112960 RepID=UPI00317BCB29